VGVIREPLAVVLGLLAFACASGAAWQSGLAWPAAARRPWARVAAALAVVLAAFGFSLGYWEVLSGIGAVIWHFDAATIHFLFDVAAFGLPMALLGLILALVAMLHAADVPPRAVIPAVIAGAAILWLLDPYEVLAGPRMVPVRERYAAAAPPNQAMSRTTDTGTSLFDSLGRFGDSGGKDPGGGGGGGGGGGDGEGGVALLVLALAVLACAGGVITAMLVFAAARKRAKAELGRHLLRTNTDWAVVPTPVPPA
jgi:hypothetical protein